ncbi:MAG: ATP-binding protein [Betaproteobacteria bacterium]|nr:ATP-binding protein [Betaproteobacteria bacterium]MDH3435975.1 ATP-binding protein [Betaproteobacteria bacterium]
MSTPEPDSTAASAGTAARRRAQVRVDQVRTVYLHSPTTTIGSLVAGAALVAVMWNHVSHPVLIGWLLALCLHQSLRVYHYRSYLRAGVAGQQSERWGKLYIMAAATSGLIWGSAGVLMYVPDSLAHQAMLVLILFGIANVTTSTLSAFGPAFYTLILLMLLPIIGRMLLDPGPARIYLAIPGIIVFLIGLSFGRTVNRIIAESKKRRFENLDLIEELRAQKAIAEQAQQEAEAANRSKTRFFAAASHDLRQPLHAMGLFAAALYEKIRDPEVLNVVKSINASVSALEGLFNELLDISKIDSGVIKPDFSHFALEGVFGRLRNDFSAEAAEKSLRLSLAGGAQIVESDPVLLERILRNLVSNAIRNTAAGEVTITAAPVNGSVRIEVRDTGPGIRPEERERIFEEFFQLANPARTSKKGLGLGLSTVKRLCGLLGYEVRLTSEIGKGSTFSLDVPLGTAPESRHDAPVAPRGGADLSGKLIVVVDDEAAIVDGMKVLLAGWGVEVIGSLTGDDVIEAVHARERMPDLIIADYRLAGGAVGTEVIERLRRELDPEIPAVVITGSTAPERVSEADAECHDLLIKPVQPDQLRELITQKLQVPSGRFPGRS